LDSVSAIGLGGHRWERIVNAALTAYAPWAVVGTAFTGVMLVILDDRRWLTVALLAQYLAAGWLVADALGVGVAGAQILGGLLVAVIIWLTWKNLDRARQAVPPANDLMARRSFRWVVVLLVLFAAWGLGRRDWMGLPGLTSTGSLGATFLMLLGVLQASLYRAPMRVVLGILTLLSGFGIAYAAVESSLAVIALLIVVHLGLALAGSYLTTFQTAAADRGGKR